MTLGSFDFASSLITPLNPAPRGPIVLLGPLVTLNVCPKIDRMARVCPRPSHLVITLKTYAIIQRRRGTTTAMRHEARRIKHEESSIRTFVPSSSFVAALTISFSIVSSPLPCPRPPSTSGKRKYNWGSSLLLFLLIRLFLLLSSQTQLG